MIRLFDAVGRTDTTPRKYSEKQFKFLNRSARKRDERIRELLETWFGEYPATDQHELKRRFESAKAQSYESAFFELSVYAILKRLGCTLTPHPVIPGTTNRPEFLVCEPDASSCFVEARLAGGESAAEAAANNLKDMIYDVLNYRIDTHDFFVDVDIRGTPTKQPSAKQIAAFVQRQLEAVDADEIIAGGVECIPCWELNIDESCSIEFRPIPRKPDVRSKKPWRPVGMTTKSGWVDDVTPIQNAVLEKANRYGTMSKPYVVAVNSMAFVLEHDDIAAALTGLWAHERVKQVSAVLLASWLMPISAAHAEIGLYHNPAAERPYSGVLTALPQGITEAGEISMVEGRTLGDIFGLADGWPRFGSDD
jgi:hypothetical protein